MDMKELFAELSRMSQTFIGAAHAANAGKLSMVFKKDDDTPVAGVFTVTDPTWVGAVDDLLTSLATSPGQAFVDVVAERVRQDEAWGTDHDDAHTHTDWCDILTGYVNRATRDAHAERDDEYRRSLVAVAALAVAAAQAYDRALAKFDPPVAGGDGIRVAIQGLELKDVVEDDGDES